MAEHFVFEPNCKFSILAIQNVREDIGCDVILQDGTRVLRKSPFTLENPWTEWLGTIQFNNLQACNLFLLRTATEGWAKGQLQVFGDEVGERLQKEVGGVFAMLRFLGTIEYEQAFMLAGYVESGKVTCRHFAQTERFNITRGCLPWVVREENLRSAAKLHNAYSLFQQSVPDGRTRRFGRGCYALKVGLERFYGTDRLHGFVRALEALVLPETGKTEKQFISRCTFFAGPKAAEGTTREALKEAYKMRSDVEHMHDWDRSLQTYAAAEREDIALWRTRQMESLACAAYTKILLDPRLGQHFYDETKLTAFWQKPEDEIRSAFGDVPDITKLQIVRGYDASGRAAASEWPSGWLEVLRRKAKLA